MEQFTAKVSKETKTALKELLDSGDFKTVNQMLENLIENYYLPEDKKKIETENTQLKQKLLEKEKIINSLTEEKDNTTGLYNSLQKANRELMDSEDKLKAEVLQLTDDKQELYDQIKMLESNVENSKLPENSKVISFDRLNLMVLKHVAEREGKLRKQDWSIDDVINYFVFYRFVKGALNGDLKSIPDKTVNEMKKTIENLNK